MRGNRTYGSVRGSSILLLKLSTRRTERYYKYYSDEEKKEVIRYHNEGIGFRRIGRLLGMVPKSVINWVKKAANHIQNIIKNSKEPENVEILELEPVHIEI